MSGEDFRKLESYVLDLGIIFKINESYWGILGKMWYNVMYILESSKLDIRNILEKS